MTKPRKPLRIAMDVQCLETAKTGIRTYTESLMREFALPGQPCHVVPLHGPHLLSTNKALNRLVNQGIRFWWWQVWLPLRLLFGRFNLLFSPDVQVPGWSPVPHVVTVHDALTVRRPEDYNRFWLWMFHTLMLPQIRRATVLTDSQFSADDIATTMGIAANHITVIPIGGPDVAQLRGGDEATAAATLARLGLIPYAYVVHMGVLEHRKNLVTLVHGFAQWRAAGAPDAFRLVLAGPSPTQPNIDDTAAIKAAITELGLEQVVILAGHVTNDERAALYTHAAVVAVPSLLEGFGIPVLEAYAARVPLIVANASSLPEVAGPGALFFDPHSPAEIAQLLDRLAHDPALRTRLVQMGETQLARFTWEHTATATLAACARAAGTVEQPLSQHA